MITSHMTSLDIECPDCEAAEGQPCINPAFGIEFTMIGYHESRDERALLHELVRAGTTPEGDSYWTCRECDWEGTD